MTRALGLGVCPKESNNTAQLLSQGMSLGYAERLAYKDDLGGQLGAPELFDSGSDLEAKLQQLACLVGAAVASRTPHLLATQLCI